MPSGWPSSIQTRRPTTSSSLAAAGATRQVACDADVRAPPHDGLRDARPGRPAGPCSSRRSGGMEGPAVDLLLARPRRRRRRGSRHQPGRSRWDVAPVRRSIPPLLDLLDHAELGAAHPRLGVDRAPDGQDLPAAGRPVEGVVGAAGPDATPGASPAAGGGRRATRRRSPCTCRTTTASPFRVPAVAVVFCLDASQSMYGYGIDAGAAPSWEDHLMDLPSTHAFEIVVFNEKRDALGRPPRQGASRAEVPRDRAPRRRSSRRATRTSTTPSSTAFGYAGRGPPPEEPAVRSTRSSCSRTARRIVARYRTRRPVVKHIGGLTRGRSPSTRSARARRCFPLLRAIAEATGGSFVDAFE